MSKTNWQDPLSGEMRSTHISGLQEAVGKLEETVGMDVVSEADIPLTEVFISNDDRYRIFQAPKGKRNWTANEPPIIKKNGDVITSGFEIDYGGGAIVLNDNDEEENTYTADVVYIKAYPDLAMPVKSLIDNKKYRLGFQVSEEGSPQLIFEEVM